jgi:FkbM family methyltransferase
LREPFEIIAALGLPKAQGILQVGANTGQEINYFLNNGISVAALVEPLDGPFATLKNRCASLPGYLPVQALCGSIDGETVEFHVSSNNGESSSLFKPARHLEDYPWVQFPTAISMQTFTLDRIFQSINVHRPEIAAVLDLLYMDVQGGELEVLKGANTVLHQVRYIYTEVGLGGGYVGDVTLSDLIQFLKNYGFDIYELEVGASGWGNAMFIKRAPGIGKS